MSLWQSLNRPTPPPPGHCANCAAALGEPRPRFCGQCGQETEIKAPTVGEFIQQFGGAYLSTEGALWRTLWRLFIPGQLTLEYFAGRRRHYVLPLRLYLTLSLIMLLVLRLSSQLEWADDVPQTAPASAASSAQAPSPQVSSVRASAAQASAVQIASALSTPAEAGAEPPAGSARPGRGVLILDEKDRQELTLLDLGRWRAGMHEGRFFCEGFSAKVCKRLERRLAADPETLRQELADLPSRVLDHLGQAMFVLLPAFALWLKLFYLDKRRRYTEHLVFALHQHAFWFALLALLTLKYEPLAALCGLAMMAHPLIALQRVYGTRWWSTLLRAFALLVAYSISLGLVLAVMFIYLFAS